MNQTRRGEAPRRAREARPSLAAPSPRGALPRSAGGAAHQEEPIFPSPKFRLSASHHLLPGLGADGKRPGQALPCDGGGAFGCVPEGFQALLELC